MQRTLTTTSSPPSVIDIEVANPNTSFLEAWCSCWYSNLFYRNWNTWSCWGHTFFFLLQGLAVIISDRGLFVLFPLTSSELFFLILLLGLLRLIAMWQSWFRILVFRFFRAEWVFVAGALGLHLRKSIVRPAVAPETTNIWVPEYIARS